MVAAPAGGILAYLWRSGGGESHLAAKMATSRKQAASNRGINRKHQ